MNKAPWYTFKEPPSWISQLQRWSPWSQGRGKILKNLAKLHKDSSSRLYDSSPPPLTEEMFLAERLFNCLLYHWSEVGHDTSYETVVNQLQKAEGLRAGGRLGGNPLFDLIFAAALMEMQNKAASHFEKEHKDHLVKTARSHNRKYHNRKYDDVDEILPSWWGEFFLYLTQPRPKMGPPLENYRGLSGIKYWFRKPLAIFLSDQAKSDKNRQLGIRFESDFISTSEKDNGMLSNTVSDYQAIPWSEEKWATYQQCVDTALEDAKKSLSNEQWDRINLCYVDQLQNKKIARIFGEDPANTTRQRNEAVKMFQKAFSEKLDKLLPDGNFQQLLSEMGFDFAEVVSNFFTNQWEQR